MNNHRSFLAALVAAAALVAPVVVGAGESTELPGPTGAQVQSATTPADHAALARAYEAEAAALESKAAGHEAMSKLYKSGGAPKGNTDAMVSHCRRLAAEYRSAAKTARELAAEQQSLAAAAGK